MNPLDYLGAGASGITAPVMPQGPLAQPPMSPLPPVAMPPGSGGMGPPPGAQLGLPSLLAGALGPEPLPEYINITQEDGSVLLRIKNPDGSPGPAVKIVPPIKQAKPPGQSAPRQ